jgi:hypothetical protein
MPRVYGLDIGDDNMAKNARCLMHAQVAICGVGVLSGVAGMVRYFLTKDTVNEWISQSGATDLQWNSSLDVYNVMEYGITVMLPLFMILLVRNAIRNNSKDLLTGVCIFEGACSFCSACTAISAVYVLPWILRVQKQIAVYDCSKSKNYSSCESDKSARKSLLTLAFVFGFVHLALSICQAVACAVGTKQADTAKNSLQIGHAFTGAPKVPVMATVTGQPQHGVAPHLQNVVVGVPV